MYLINRLIPPGVAFLDGYFNDILAGCVILAVTNFLLSVAHLRTLLLPLPCLALCLGCGLIWEFVTPLYKPGAVCDIWDIAAYMLGGLVWCIIVKIVERKC